MVQIHEWTKVEALAREGESNLGDKRRNRRLQQVLVSIGANPHYSLPHLFPDKAELEGVYRLLGNGHVDWRQLMSGHVAATVERCASAGTVLAVHDTTDIRFQLYDPESLRQHLSRPSSMTQGFQAHTTIAATAEGAAVPLGTLGVQPFVNQSKVEDEAAKDFWREQGGWYDSERKRWFDGIANAEALLGSDASVIHVADRESDSFPMLAWLASNTYRHVLRMCVSDRRAVEDAKASTTMKLLAEVPFAIETEALVSKRSPLGPRRPPKRNPVRRRRKAKLSIRARSVTLWPSKPVAGYCPPGFELPEELSVNLVEVLERCPPLNEKPIHWLLFTSEPIESPDQILAVVDLYRRRWVIEEFFKSLKTGCSLEKRQMESAAALLKMLAMLLPIAWHLLVMRSLDRSCPDAPWDLILAPLTFRILCAKAPKAGLGQHSTVREVVYAIAGLGGHIRRNGPPGWQTLHRGIARLRSLEDGVRLAAELNRSAQKEVEETAP